MAWLGRALRSYMMPPDPHYRPASKPLQNTEDGLFKIYPKQLSITWGSDKRYWNLPSPEIEDEHSYAELKQVSWLEVTGSKENLESGQSYKVGFHISMTPDAFGWDDCSVYIMAKIGKRGKFTFKQVILGEKIDGTNFDVPEDQLIIQVPNSLNQSSDDLKLYFGMYEVWSKRWKGGLRIHHAFVQKL